MASDLPPSEAEGGIFRKVRQFIQASIQYSSARMRLARLEGKEAGAHAVKVLLLIAAVAGMAVFAWLFLCLGAVAWMAAKFENWAWAALAMAGMHIALLLIFSAMLKRMSAVALFPLTTEELRKDREWLETQTQTKQP